MIYADLKNANPTKSIKELRTEFAAKIVEQEKNAATTIQRAYRAYRDKKKASKE